MDEKKLQDKELKQVSGGGADVPHYDTCPKCGAKYQSGTWYPTGFINREEKHQCSSSTWYYKCPDCGHEWSSDD